MQSVRTAAILSVTFRFVVTQVASETGWGEDVVAYGPVIPWTCKNGAYQPTVRVATAMGMLVFPIIFYAVYQCCCAGETSCFREHNKSASSESSSEIPITGGPA